MKNPLIAILLGTRNGASHLQQQLDSFAQQSSGHWGLYVSDDGSSDSTLSTIELFKSRAPQMVSIVHGPQRGFSENFMSLARRPDLRGDYFAFSDQDDIWMPDKLETAVEQLNKIDQDIPAVYFGRTELMDETGKTIGFSPLFRRAPSFLNALVQSIGGANTCVFNRSAKKLLEQSLLPVASHDWWLYQIVTGSGGVAIYDPVPKVIYRQHRQNASGSNVGIFAAVQRIRMVSRNNLKEWNSLNICALQAMRQRLTKENGEIVDLFDKARSSDLLAAVYWLNRSGVYRQNPTGDIALNIFAALGKI